MIRSWHFSAGSMGPRIADATIPCIELGFAVAASLPDAERDAEQANDHVIQLELKIRDLVEVDVRNWSIVIDRKGNVVDLDLRPTLAIETNMRPVACGVEKQLIVGARMSPSIVVAAWKAALKVGGLSVRGVPQICSLVAKAVSAIVTRAKTFPGCSRT
jgi:hypothetical protein